MEEPEFDPKNKIFDNIYLCTKCIASGAYGVVYAGINMQTEKDVALKLEKQASRKNYLKIEFDCYALLDGLRGFPKIYYFGSIDNNRVLVMDRLGPSLRHFLQLCGGQLSLKTVLMLAPQMIRRVQGMHERGMLHCDIKPDNFVMGRGLAFNTVYMVDLGLVREYRDKATHQHIPQTYDAGLCGTLNYMSINVHLGKTQSRRDDLQALGYVFIRLLTGRLPWQKIKEPATRKSQKLIYKMKRSMPASELCQNIPKPFEQYVNYCRRLKFDKEPDYAHLVKLFRDLFDKEGYAHDYDYDWIEQICMQSAEKDVSSVNQTAKGATQRNEDCKTVKMQKLTEKCISFSAIPFEYRELKEKFNTEDIEDSLS